MHKMWWKKCISTIFFSFLFHEKQHFPQKNETNAIYSQTSECNAWFGDKQNTVGSTVVFVKRFPDQQSEYIALALIHRTWCLFILFIRVRSYKNELFFHEIPKWIRRLKKTFIIFFTVVWCCCHFLLFHMAFMWRKRINQSVLFVIFFFNCGSISSNNPHISLRHRRQFQLIKFDIEIIQWRSQAIRAVLGK